MSINARSSRSELLHEHTRWLTTAQPEADVLVATLLRIGPESTRLAHLINLKERALPALARGAVALPRLPESQQEGAQKALQTALEAVGADAAAPVVVAAMASGQPTRQRLAIACLFVLTIPAALPDLFSTLWAQENHGTSLAARTAQRYWHTQEFMQLCDDLRALCLDGETQTRQKAIAVLAAVRDRKSLPTFVQFLGVKPKEIADSSLQALIDVTKQDFGTTERRWRAWLAEQERASRIAWLLDALERPNLAIRSHAHEELRTLTGRDFGYRSDASPTARDAAIDAWLSWWQQEQKLPDAASRWP